MTTQWLDNRQFGRRRSLIHAFIINTRGLRLSCLVRNISGGGGLLEVENPLIVPQRLTLLIDADQFEAECEVKHRTHHAVGVYFREIRIGRHGRDTRFAGPQLVNAMRDIRLSDLAR